MSAATSRVDDLDLSLFAAVGSQSSQGDKRSLLAVQRAVGRARGGFGYLEIGSFRGGSIQPYLVDSRCSKIYSIDTRPREGAPDERKAGCVWEYEDNSTQGMLDRLSAIDPVAVGKIVCFDQDSADVDPALIDPKPEVAFIDGEHTKKAVLSDFAFCRKIIAEGGVILFHDTGIIFPAIIEIVDNLRNESFDGVAFLLDDNVSGIFFDRSLVFSDPFLSECYQRNKNHFNYLKLKSRIKEHLPESFWTWMKQVKSAVVKKKSKAG